MNRIIFAALLCAGCMSPHEGEHANIAGLDLEGMAWRIDCNSTTQAELNQRFRREMIIVSSDEVHQQTTDISIGRVAVVRDHYWAGRELSACTH